MELYGRSKLDIPNAHYCYGCGVLFYQTHYAPKANMGWCPSCLPSYTAYLKDTHLCPPLELVDPSQSPEDSRALFPNLGELVTDNEKVDSSGGRE